MLIIQNVKHRRLIYAWKKDIVSDTQNLLIYSNTICNPIYWNYLKPNVDF